MHTRITAQLYKIVQYSRYVSDLQTAVSQMSSPPMQSGRSHQTMAQRHDAPQQAPPPPPNQHQQHHHQPTTININERARLGLSDLSGVNLNERLMQERAAHNRLVQERVLQERAIQERAIQERILQERALQERALLHERPPTLHGPPLIIPTSAHVITAHERIEKSSSTPTSAMQNTIASPGPV